jgi:hypothetical protein
MAMLAGIVMLGAAAPARADLEIVLHEAGFTDVYFSATIAGSNGAMSAPSPLTFGDFTITGLQASQQNATSSNLQSSNLTITNNTGTAHSLTITTYGNNFTLPAGSPLEMFSSAGGNIFLPGTPADTNMTHTGFINNANTGIDPPVTGTPAITVPMETTPGAQAPSFSGNSFQNGTGQVQFSRSNPNFSLTSLAMVNVGANAGIHFTETLQVIAAVPAPEGLTVVLLALPVFGLAYWWRRRAVLA